MSLWSTLHSPGERPAVPHPTTTATVKQAVQPHIGYAKAASVRSSDNPDHDHRPVGQAVLFAEEAVQTATSPKVSSLTPDVAAPAALPYGLLEIGKTVATLSDASPQTDLLAHHKLKKAPLSRSKPGSARSRPTKRARESSIEPQPQRKKAPKAVKLDRSMVYDVENLTNFAFRNGTMYCKAEWAPTEVQLCDVVGDEAMAICEREITSRFGADVWAKQKAACFDQKPEIQDVNDRITS
ncbi:uncharacterized protein VDAG_05144 [Verticillium dahliae VdLs.17]|uniref:Uncharacterized protein n=1 Tax=Verticillium dahliae (strain VdLs.17 / ATCC MYA-4575 / FGSC 10137) TaxID=498257 RepID=G2X4R2_VERDV|nr:uncharacterized protein VDAG_05144 [Verticillium dahliae VdLs.17]EGY23706.1 hypothetical protein VDAG_05144 [Verticillium dahliae VdLs.17]